MMLNISRADLFKAHFADQPAYRWRQAEAALFADRFFGWNEVSTLPKGLREAMKEMIPWMSIEPVKIFESARHDTHKAVVAGLDGQRFETVLMENAREQWTICVSSQVGCAMRCTFCATGMMGLKRSLTSDEIVDQYRFWQQFLKQHSSLPQRISNVVFMGMGEPLANYENVKEAIQTWLRHTDLGPTRITVSTVGVLPVLEKILTDPNWPPVRIAISLHSANPERRKAIVPTTVPGFLEKLVDWSHRYQNTLGNRRHHVTYEYTLLSGVNDTSDHAKELAAYIQKTGFSKVNVIPYNPVPGKPFLRSQTNSIETFKEILRQQGIEVTQRRTMGDDIAAACGQLVVEKEA